MIRTNLINLLINHIGAKAYLEIGTSDGKNFESINCVQKIGVDPNPNAPATFHITSDEFFKTNTSKFDIIFIDGLHVDTQVSKDIDNALSCLSDDGYIICHDMLPTTKEMQSDTYNSGFWTGTCWKAFVKLRASNPELEMYTVDTDYGCGIIKKGKQSIIPMFFEDYTYEKFVLNKKEWMNIISVNQLYEKLNLPVTVEDLLCEYIDNPEEPMINFRLALHYHSIGQTASAVSYYLRAAERTTEVLLQYECMLRASSCFDAQGMRGNSVKGLLQHAIAIQPKRPEAYYFLSRYYERASQWQDCYLIASIGETVCNFAAESLREQIDYPGAYGIVFEKAVSAWWCGLCGESKRLFRDLLNHEELNDVHKTVTINNLTRLNVSAVPDATFTSYNISKYSQMKIKFNGLENIKKNYSQAYQDMFVLTMLNGKKRGTYLEIGGADAYYGNNSALLEESFGWSGISIDWNARAVELFNNQRKNKMLHANALEVSYRDLFNNQYIDYLQIDVDPVEVSYNTLLRIPFDYYRFGVITFEHDYYNDSTKSFRSKQRTFLEKQGYVLVCGNIAFNHKDSFEDWWVHPKLINKQILDKMMCTNDAPKKAQTYMMGLV